MKRAYLKTAKVPVASSATHDVTDRLLKTDGDPVPRKPKSSDKPSGRAQPASSSPSPTPEPLSYTPYVTVSETPTQPFTGPTPRPPRLPDLSQADEPIAQAFATARTSIELLQIAARSGPAQYDLAIRYRLDALTHHLEQVAEFLVARRP